MRRVGHRPVRYRTPARARSARAHARRMLRRRGRRRPEALGHQRAVHVPRQHDAAQGVHRGLGLRGDRCHAPRGGLVRQRGRDAGSAGLGDEGDTGHRGRHGRSRPVLPLRLGRQRAGHQRAGQPGARRRERRHHLCRRLPAVDAAVRLCGRTHLGGPVRPGPHGPLRHHVRAARPDRHQRPAQCRPEPQGDLPGAVDARGLFQLPDDHHTAASLRLRRTLRRRHCLRHLAPRVRSGIWRSRRSTSRPWAPRSTIGRAGTSSRT